MTSKRKRKTHLTLLIYVFLMLAGSAIWLKYTLRGDRTGHPRSKPSWLRTFNGKPIVEGFSLDVDFGECEFLEPETGPSATLEAQNYCGLSNAMVPVTATIDAVNDNMDGLYLVVLASKDFKAWWQANAVLLPREMFALNETSLTAQRLAQLQATFDAAGLGATETTPQAGRVDITRLVQPLRDEFSGAGAVAMTASLVSSQLILQAGGGAPCEPPCYANFNEFVGAYVNLTRLYSPKLTVKTTACMGPPGFTYVAGCVTSGMPTDNRRLMNCASPPCKGVSGPVGFGMVQAVIVLWVTHDPLMFILKGNAPRLSLRYVEVSVLVLMALITSLIIASAAD